MGDSTRRIAAGLALLLCLTLPAPAQEAATPPQVRLRTTSYALPGGMVMLNVEASPELSGLQARFRGAAIPFFPTGPGRYRALVGLAGDLPPGKHPIEVLDGAGQPVLSRVIQVKPRRFPTQYLGIDDPKLTAAQKAILAQEDAQVDKAKATASEQALWQGPFRPPVRAAVSTTFGVRRFYRGRPGGFHRGVDFLVGLGVPVGASQAGRVALARVFSPFNSNGNMVMIDHGHGVVTAYLHLSKVLVREGDSVAAGQAVGLVGSTGRSTGPHLHWGVYLNGLAVDGLQWLPFSKSLGR